MEVPSYFFCSCLCLLFTLPALALALAFAYACLASPCLALPALPCSSFMLL
jgi:hypothetical protein